MDNTLTLEPEAKTKQEGLEIQNEVMTAIAAVRERQFTTCREQRSILRNALAGITKRYVELVNCGDCGHWNPEEEDSVIAARAALQMMEDHNG